MAAYKLSREADRKLAEIYEYSLLNFGEAQADKYFHSLHEAFELLMHQPELGRPFHEYRRHEHEAHVIFYKADSEGIHIVRVLHKREETEGKFD